MSVSRISRVPIVSTASEAGGEARVRGECVRNNRFMLIYLTNNDDYIGMSVR